MASNYEDELAEDPASLYIKLIDQALASNSVPSRNDPFWNKQNEVNKQLLEKICSLENHQKSALTNQESVNKDVEAVVGSLRKAFLDFSSQVERAFEGFKSEQTQSNDNNSTNFSALRDELAQKSLILDSNVDALRMLQERIQKDQDDYLTNRESMLKEIGTRFTECFGQMQQMSGEISSTEKVLYKMKKRQDWLTFALVAVVVVLIAIKII